MQTHMGNRMGGNKIPAEPEKSKGVTRTKSKKQLRLKQSTSANQQIKPETK